MASLAPRSIVLTLFLLAIVLSPGMPCEATRLPQRELLQKCPICPDICVCPCPPPPSPPPDATRLPQRELLLGGPGPVCPPCVCECPECPVPPSQIDNAST